MVVKTIIIKVNSVLPCLAKKRYQLVEEESPTHMQLTPQRPFLCQQYWIIRNLHTSPTAMSSASQFQILYSTNLSIRVLKGREPNFRIVIKDLTVYWQWLEKILKANRNVEECVPSVLWEVNSTCDFVKIKVHRSIWPFYYYQQILWRNQNQQFILFLATILGGLPV